VFQVGDHVVYGKKGVCRVAHVGYPTFSEYAPKKLYYTLIPLDTNETIYTPVEGKVFIRPAMDEQQALLVIDSIPMVEGQLHGVDAIGSKELPRYYGELLQTHRTEDVVRLIITAYRRSQKALEDGRKISQTDQDYLHTAEWALYGELALALGIPRGDVADFIKNRLENR